MTSKPYRSHVRVTTGVRLLTCGKYIAQGSLHGVPVYSEKLGTVDAAIRWRENIHGLPAEGKAKFLDAWFKRKGRRSAKSEADSCKHIFKRRSRFTITLGLQSGKTIYFGKFKTMEAAQAYLPKALEERDRLNGGVKTRKYVTTPTKRTVLTIPTNLGKALI